MSGDVEYGKCDVCRNDNFITRKYYYYNIKCECHSPQHFDIVYHCSDCEPIPPKTTKIELKVETLKDIRKEKLIIIENEIGK